MKRLLLLVLVSLAVLAPMCNPMETILYAQVPATVRAQWDPNAATDNVVQYLVTLDTAAPVTLLATACTTTCVQALTVPSFGVHTVSVVAQNLDFTGALQSGPALSVTFTLAAKPLVVARLRVTN